MEVRLYLIYSLANLMILSKETQGDFFGLEKLEYLHAKGRVSMEFERITWLINSLKI